MTVVTALEVEGRRLRVSNPGRVLWPAAGFTKAQMIEYYVAVAPALLPHLAGRPLTLRRFPEGVEAPNWYATQCPPGRPSWLPTVTLAGRRGRTHELCVVGDLPSLVWVANLGAIELHPLLARARRPEQPTAVVFDLDPGPPADLISCCRVALRLRDALADLGLTALAKTSGSVGLHVYVPLNTPHTYAETKAFARAVAARLASEHPEEVTEAMRKSTRAGKVFVDWVQNDAARSTVAAYSLRGTGWPTVSTPVTWDEVGRALAVGKPELLTFETAAVLRRLDGVGDLFRPVEELEQALPG
jgi:bifunctional non-homologous end joining protein LigD